jgi:hypothetical protein
MQMSEREAPTVVVPSTLILINELNQPLRHAAEAKSGGESCSAIARSGMFDTIRKQLNSETQAALEERTANAD